MRFIDTFLSKLYSIKAFLRDWLNWIERWPPEPKVACSNHVSLNKKGWFCKSKTSLFYLLYSCAVKIRRRVYVCAYHSIRLFFFIIDFIFFCLSRFSILAFVGFVFLRFFCGFTAFTMMFSILKRAFARFRS